MHQPKVPPPALTKAPAKLECISVNQPNKRTCQSFMKNNILRFLAACWTIALGIALPFTTRASEPVQWTTAAGGNGHYYQVVSVTNGISWQQARNAAASMGGYLATVTSAEENDF